MGFLGIAGSEGLTSLETSQLYRICKVFELGFACPMRLVEFVGLVSIIGFVGLEYLVDFAGLLSLAGFLV